jgi:hypothetical protein
MGNNPPVASTEHLGKRETAIFSDMTIRRGMPCETTRSSSPPKYPIDKRQIKPCHRAIPDICKRAGKESPHNRRQADDSCNSF